VKLCLPVADARGGGMYSFFRNLRAWLSARKIAYTDRLEDDWDVLIVNSWAMPYRRVAGLKRRRPDARVLHRIDGSAVDYGRDVLSDVRQALVNACADVTVFQSAYGREATRRRRVIVADGPVVHNPVDVERFRPDGPRADLPGRLVVAHVAFSANARKGGDDVYAIARRRPDVTIVMVGAAPAAAPPTNVLALGYLAWDRLPEVLRSAHVMLTLSENETCPNVVLEGLASGLPVLYRRSGGTPELVGDAGAEVTVDTFDQALASVMDRRAALADAARGRAVERFAFDAIFPRYLDAASTARRRPAPAAAVALGTVVRVRPPVGAVARWALRRGTGPVVAAGSEPA
jgi:glycosyltransferase involved in cell wall biosynthesis